MRGAIQDYVNKEVSVAFSATVIGLNGNGTVNLQIDELPLLKVGTYSSKPLIVQDIQVATFKFGEFRLNVPIRIGDNVLCLVTDSYTQTGNHKPDEYQRHKWQNAIVIGALNLTNSTVVIEKDYVLYNGSKEVFRISEDGQTTTINTRLVVNGDTTINGNAEVVGNVEATGDVLAGAISLTNHVHGNVMNGGGSTSPPQ